MGETNCVGLRTVAFLIDWAIVATIINFIYFLAGKEQFSEYDIAGVTEFLGYYVFFFLYSVLFSLINRGRTIGKLIVNLEVNTVEGSEVLKSKAVLRSLIKTLILPIFPLSFVILWTNIERRTIHDIILGTIVVKRD